MKQTSLSDLLQHGALWRGDHTALAARPGLPSGFAALDRALPGSGWPTDALTEILGDRQGIGELSLIVPAIAAQTRQGRGVVLVNPPYWLYAPAWAGHDVVLAQCLVLRPERIQDMLWATEQSLRAGACALVVMWPEYRGYEPDYRILRRLHTAADTGKTAGIIFRSERTASEATPAPLRLQLAAESDALRINIIKRRGSPVTQPILLPRYRPGQPSGKSTPLPLGRPGFPSGAENRSDLAAS